MCPVCLYLVYHNIDKENRIWDIQLLIAIVWKMRELLKLSLRCDVTISIRRRVSGGQYPGRHRPPSPKSSSERLTKQWSRDQQIKPNARSG